MEECTFLATLEKTFTFSYHENAWSTFNCYSPHGGIIAQNITLLKEWAVVMGLVRDGEPYRFIGQEIPLISRTGRSGLVRYDIKSLPPELEALNLPEGSACLILHFDALIEQKGRNENITNLFSAASVRKLKRVIQKKHPGISVVIAESWLLDTIVNARFGFHLLPLREQGVPSNQGFWGQFIDQHGNIHKGRTKQFLETGIAPYQIRAGYLLADEFLAR